MAMRDDHTDFEGLYEELKAHQDKLGLYALTAFESKFGRETTDFVIAHSPTGSHGFLACAKMQYDNIQLSNHQDRHIHLENFGLSPTDLKTARELTSLRYQAADTIQHTQELLDQGPTFSENEIQERAAKSKATYLQAIKDGTNSGVKPDAVRSRLADRNNGEIMM